MGGVIRTNAAAAMLGVSPNTLRSWERRFGFPEPRRTAGGHRQFDLAEVEALRAAFEATHNVSSAISIARERGAGPATEQRLRSALSRFDEEAADRLLEESLAVRSVERTVDEVLLPAIASLDDAGPERESAARWATRWLSAVMRTAPPATREDGVLIFDAGEALGADALAAHGLELTLRRAGLRTLTLTARLDPARMTAALHALRPRVVVLAGQGASRDALGRLVYAARRTCGEGLAVVEFRGALGASHSTVEPLPAGLLAARDRITALLDPSAAQRPRLTAVG